MKVTVLTENTSAHGLPYEHGLSLYIEAVGKKILFDTGQSGLFADNAQRLGIDLAAVDFAVISHGHYDHGGGISRFLEINNSAPVYLNAHAFGDYFNADDRYIGLDKGLKDSGRIKLTDCAVGLAQGVSLHPADEIPTVIDMGSAGLTMEQAGKKLPDDFRHEQYLLIVENGRRILFSGCAHKGIINITDRFRPDIVFGGFHFMKMPLSLELRGYAERLDSYNAVYYTCHCTGPEQYGFIKPYIDNMRYISAGDIIEI